MGLLTKEVEVGLCSKNIDYYEKLGYEIPRYYNKNSCTWRVKRSAKIIVDIKHISHYARYKVDVDCDCCGKHLSMPYQQYNTNKHDDKYYCAKCATSIFNSGENNPSWNPNLTDEERIIKRQYPEYNEFVKRVLLRDKYTCKCCGHRGGTLEVHHLNGYNWFVEGRTDETNAVVLCQNCHTSFHSIYGQGDNTKEQFEEWLGKSIGLLEKYNGVMPIGRKVICYETLEIYDSPVDIEKKLKITSQRIIDCCNRRDVTYGGRRHRTVSIQGKHYFWLDEYENMSEEDFDKYWEWCKPIKPDNSGKNNYGSKAVVCLTTLEKFDCISDAKKKYKGTQVTNISRCCEGTRKHCGKLEDGTKLQWMYYKDYIEKFDESTLLSFDRLST